MKLIRNKVKPPLILSIDHSLSLNNLMMIKSCSWTTRLTLLKEMKHTSSKRTCSGQQRTFFGQKENKNLEFLREINTMKLVRSWTLT